VRTGITSPAHALASASMVLTAAIICAGAASADPSPSPSPGPSQQELQDFFVTQLEADQIPAMDNLPALVARAHQICNELDGGASVYAVVDEEMNGMYEQNPEYRQMSARVRKTAVRFIATSIQVYCPSHFYDPYIGSNAGFAIPGPAAGVGHQTLPTRIAAVWTPRPSGDITQPEPPQVPPPPPPRAQIQTPPRPVAPPPPPKQPPPPPRQVEPPAVAPQPGDAAGGVGGGSADGGGNGGGSPRGGGGPAGPPPVPSMGPGFVGLAP
jgi:hypothetical protein